MNISYLLSSSFPYSQLICSDAGPAIAEEYGWSCLFLADLPETSLDALVVDNRHHGIDELTSLRHHILSTPSCPVLLRVNDPFLFHLQDPWYHFCASLLGVSHVHFLTPYQPTGILSHWLSLSPHTQFIYAPFTYSPESERPLNHHERRQRLAVSGNQRPDLYPLRFVVQRASKFRLTQAILRTQRLHHPGYPEKCGSPAHTIMGSSYIQWLSQFTAAFTDSSIYRIEFLKYREIAYAGCAPVGDLPWSLFQCPPQAFVQFTSWPDLFGLRGLLHDPDHTQAVALAFRQFMHQQRDRNQWRARVSAAIARLL